MNDEKKIITRTNNFYNNICNLNIPKHFYVELIFGSFMNVTRQTSVYHFQSNEEIFYRILAIPRANSRKGEKRRYDTKMSIDLHRVLGRVYTRSCISQNRGSLECVKMALFRSYRSVRLIYDRVLKELMEAK